MTTDLVYLNQFEVLPKYEQNRYGCYENYATLLGIILAAKTLANNSKNNATVYLQHDNN